MPHFDKIREALAYIDGHLEDKLSLEMLAEQFHFSPYYFHRMFSVIVGKSLAAHIRDRRLLRACVLLSSTEETVLDIGLESGYDTPQSFSRAFKTAYGLTPREYRGRGCVPSVVMVDEMIIKFTNRLQGGILVNPNIIKRGPMRIAGVSGDGDKTAQVWARAEDLNKGQPLESKLSDNSYEIRLHDGKSHTVHTGYLVGPGQVPPPYGVMELPASTYASFEVYVAKGYDSENNAINDWLAHNKEGYTERLLGEAHWCVEYYDQRFSGEESGSIVEIWIPIEKV